MKLTGNGSEQRAQSQQRETQAQPDSQHPHQGGWVSMTAEQSGLGDLRHVGHYSGFLVLPCCVWI